MCCNGVCNARILSIVSVPNVPGAKGTDCLTNQSSSYASSTNPSAGYSSGLTNQSSGQWTSSASDWSTAGWSTPSGTGGWSTPDSGTVEWAGVSSASGGHGHKYKHWTVGSEAGTADSSPQSANTGHLDCLETEDDTSDEEEIVTSVQRKQSLVMAMEQTQSSEQVGTGGGGQATMWLGTEDGTIHVYNCTDNIRIKKNKDKFCHTAPILAIL